VETTVLADGLSKDPMDISPDGRQYAVTKDGQRFLVNTAVPTPLPVTVVSDWTAPLKK